MDEIDAQFIMIDQAERRAKAYDFARKKHAGQFDDDGNCYFSTHVLQVYKIIMFVSDDEDLMCAALLHDTIEDTHTTYEELVKEFNQRIADLVMEVTHEGKKDNYGFFFPRLKTKDGILLKFADRISNLSRMGSWPIDRQNQYLRKSKFWKDGNDRNTNFSRSDKRTTN